MGEEKKVESTDEDEKNLDEEKSEEDKKSEEDESKKEDKENFEKDSENVSSNKYNQALRKQRELEEKLRVAEQGKPENTKKKVVKKDEDDDDDDFFDDEEKSKKKEIDNEIIEPISNEVRELRERLDAREADDKTKQRKAFFKAHPEYLNNSDKWQELLDEMDNSLNPKSKDSYFKQLSKAHRLIADPVSDKSEVEKKKAEMAADLSNKGDDAKKKDNDKKIDDRAMRLAQKMPKGYEFDVKK